ncbi:hypothetical protein Tco_1008250, partial [Tanacetum coccineum]
EEESAEEMLIRRRHKKGKGIKESRSSPPPTPIRSPKTHIAPLSMDKETLQELTVITEDVPSSVDKEKLQELMVTDPKPSSSTPFLDPHQNPKQVVSNNARVLFIRWVVAMVSLKEMLPSMVNKEVNKIAKSIVPVYVAEGLLLEKKKTQDDVVDSFLRNYMSNNILHVHPTQTAQATAQEQQLYLTMKNDEQLQLQDLPTWLSLKIKFEGITAATAYRPFTIRLIDHDDYQDDDACLEGENSAKRQKTSEHGTYSAGESSSGQAMDHDQNPSGSGTQEQLDAFDAWMEDARTDDDDVPDDKISQELVEEMSGEIDEAKLQKAINEMLRQRCNSREEHQYHLDQMKNYLKSDIFWESRN